MQVYSANASRVRKTSYLRWVVALLTIALVPLLAACNDNPTSPILSASTATVASTTTIAATVAVSTPTPIPATATPGPVASPSPSATSATQLKEFVSQPGKFSILLPLPGVPSIDSNNWIQVSEGWVGRPGSALTYTLGTNRTDGIIIWLGYADFEADYVSQRGAAPLFDSQRQNIEHMPGVDIKVEKDLTLANKYPGKEYRYTASGFGEFVQRYYLVDNRLYTIVVAAILNGFPRYTLQMLDSFKVTA